MKNRWVLGGVALAVGALVCTLLLRQAGAAGASALSASPGGLLAARTYLERSGSKISLLDRPLGLAPAKNTRVGSLVLAFPGQGYFSRDDLDALRRRLVVGGTIVFAYSGSAAHARGEGLVADTLGLEFAETRGKPPLSPLRWYEFAREVWRLDAEKAFAPASAQPAVVRAPDRVPKAPKDAAVLYRGIQEIPAVFSFGRSRGRVIVLPADALSNARLGNPGNADLLESLRVALGEDVAFDEYHHGLAATDAVATSGNAANVDLFMMQLVVLYLSLAWALGKRFGPAWEDPPEIASSAEAYLLGLGVLHHKLGHAAPACIRLLDDVESLDPRVAVPRELRHIAFDAGEEAFLNVARVVTRLQRRGR